MSAWSVKTQKVEHWGHRISSFSVQLHDIILRLSEIKTRKFTNFYLVDLPE